MPSRLHEGFARAVRRQEWFARQNAGDTGRRGDNQDAQNPNTAVLMMCVCTDQAQQSAARLIIKMHQLYIQHKPLRLQAVLSHGIINSTYLTTQLSSWINA